MSCFHTSYFDRDINESESFSRFPAKPPEEGFCVAMQHLIVYFFMFQRSVFFHSGVRTDMDYKINGNDVSLKSLCILNSRLG